MKLSNKFTLVRAVFAPVFFLIYHIPIWFASAQVAKISAFIMLPLLAAAEFTDYLDGHYARKLSEVSDFGKLFDPFADVILNLTVFLCAFSSINKAFSPYMPILFFVLIMYREFSMTFMMLAASVKGITIAARKGGKLKTVFYISSGILMLAVESALRLGLDISPYFSFVRTVLLVMFSLCVLLSYVSFADYLIHFIPAIRKK